MRYCIGLSSLCVARLLGQRSLRCLPVTRPPAGWVCVLANARLDVMARVDPDDDKRRYIVRHYRHDPERHDRRHVVVAAFDSRREFSACLDAISEEIRWRSAA